MHLGICWERTCYDMIILAGTDLTGQANHRNVISTVNGKLQQALNMDWTEFFY